MKSSLYYKNPINLPKTGHELVTCHYPLRLDTYSGCIHDCVYCYAKNLLESRGYWRPIRSADPSHVEKILEQLLQYGEKNGLSNSVKRKIPFRLGGLTDCFQPNEKEKKVTETVLETLNRYEYPYLIVTKSPADRLKALQILNDAEYFTTARFSPIIPNVNLAEAGELFEAYSNAGANHVLIEFFRGNIKMIERIERTTNTRIKQFFVRDGYYYRYNFGDKFIAYKKLKKLARKFNMKFSICSDGDPVPFELNDTRNCCGTDNIKCFRGVERVASTLYFVARKKGKITLNDMSNYWTPVPEVFERFWFSGAFEKFVFGLKWSGRDYFFEGGKFDNLQLE